MSTPRFPAITPTSVLGERCGIQDEPWRDRCLEPSIDGTTLCESHARRVHKVGYCSYVIEHDDGGLVACGALTAARGVYVRCTEHVPSWRVLGIDGGGPL